MDIVNQLKIEQKTHESGLIVASMSFGFWTAFFHHDFEIFWREHPQLKQIFPYFELRPFQKLLRKLLMNRFQSIKEIRNRVFHHEPIWNQKHLYTNYQKALDIIYWISPEYAALLEKIDRFVTVYNQGIGPYELLARSHSTISS